MHIPCWTRGCSRKREHSTTPFQFRPFFSAISYCKPEVHCCPAHRGTEQQAPGGSDVLSLPDVKLAVTREGEPAFEVEVPARAVIGDVLPPLVRCLEVRLFSGSLGLRGGRGQERAVGGKAQDADESIIL
jgi:hypothetical protein